MGVVSTLVSSLVANGGGGQKFHVVDSEVEMLAIVGRIGDVAIRTDINQTFILKAYPASDIDNWQPITFPDAVWSVFGRVGSVVAADGDYNTSQVTESVSNLYFTDARVRATTLTGLSITNSAITASDTVLSAFGKLQGQISDVAGGQWELVPTTSYLRPELALNITGIRLYNAAQSQSVKISYESNGIYYDATDPTQPHRFWQLLQAETAIKLNNGAGSLSSATGIQYYFNDTAYRFGFDDTGGTGKLRFNIPTANSTYRFAFTAGALASNNIIGELFGHGRLRITNTDDLASGGWVAGMFGGSATPQVIMGSLSGVATVAAHNTALNAYTPLNLRSDGQIMTAYASQFNVIGLANVYTSDPTGFSVRDASAVSKRIYLFHDSTNNVGILESLQDSVAYRPILINPNGTTASSGVAVCLPSSGAILKAGFHVETTSYFKDLLNLDSISPPGNPAQGVYIFNASGVTYSRDTAGNVQNLTGSNPPRLISAADSNRETDEIVCLDTTSSSFIFEIDMDKLKRPLTVVVSSYVNTGQIRAKSGQFINGTGVAINIPAGNWSVLTIMPSATANNMFISGTA